MKRVFISFFQVFRQMKNDPMLSAACIAPFLMGVVIHSGVPLLERSTGISLSEYYLIFDLFLSVMAPVLLCFAFAMVTLEEIDDKVARYFSITPLGKRGYLYSRLGIPPILAAMVTVVVLFIFSLTKQTLLMTICMAVTGAVQAVMVAFMVIGLSSNKLEGMAVTKLATLTLLGTLAPFFVTGRLQLAAGFLPSFWAAKMVQEESAFLLFPAVMAAACWFLFLGKRLFRKLSV